MLILGFVAAILMGATLGLLGAGGSILTIPILIYLHQVPPTLATAYGLIIVGLTALIGALRYFFRAQVDFRGFLLVGIPSLLAVYATRRWVLPEIPDTLFSLGEFTLTKDGFILTLFAIIMIIASISMIKKTKTYTTKKRSNLLIVFDGILVGFITGLEGTGGGFMIVPVLTNMVGLKMRVAVGTSLSIVAFKSLLGVLGDVHAGAAFDWVYLSTFVAMAILGMLIGTTLSRKIDTEKLKPAFGYMVLIIGCCMLIGEFV